MKLNKIPSNDACLLSNEDGYWLRYRRIFHILIDHFKLVHKNIVEGLPDLHFERNKLCDGCQKGKQVRTSFKGENIVSIDRPLQLFHIDLFGPSRTLSLGGNVHALVIVDD